MIKYMVSSINGQFSLYGVIQILNFNFLNNILDCYCGFVSSSCLDIYVIPVSKIRENKLEVVLYKLEDIQTLVFLLMNMD